MNPKLAAIDYGMQIRFNHNHSLSTASRNVFKLPPAPSPLTTPRTITVFYVEDTDRVLPFPHIGGSLRIRSDPISQFTFARFDKANKLIAIPRYSHG